MKHVRLAIALIVMASLAACGALFTTQTGSLTVGIGENVSRSILPGISMTVADFRLVVSGSGGVVFDQVVTEQTTIEGLQPGAFTIEVYGRNADGTSIGYGSANTVVEVGGNSVVNITVTEYAGTGELDVLLEWQPDIVFDPSIVSYLAKGLGTPTDISDDWEVYTDSTGLNPRLGDTTSTTYTGWLGEADLSLADLDHGWYTLQVRVLDTGLLSTGAVELVRIAAGHLTAGVISLTANAASGGLVINIDTDFYEALALNTSRPAGHYEAFDGVAAPEMSLSTADGSNATFAWFENGIQKQVDLDSSSDYVFDHLAYTVDSHVRVDAIAISADGKRAGQLTWTFDIKEGSTIITYSFVAPGTSANVYLMPEGSSGYNDTQQWHQELAQATWNTGHNSATTGALVAGETYTFSTPALPHGRYKLVVEGNGKYEIWQGAQYWSQGTEIVIPGPTADLFLDFGVLDF